MLPPPNKNNYLIRLLRSLSVLPLALSSLPKYHKQSVGGKHAVSVFRLSESRTQSGRDRGSKSKKEREETKRHPSVRALTQCLREMWAARLRTVTYFSYDVLYDIAALAKQEGSESRAIIGGKWERARGEEAGCANERETLK